MKFSCFALTSFLSTAAASTEVAAASAAIDKEEPDAVSWPLLLSTSGRGGVHEHKQQHHSSRNHHDHDLHLHNHNDGDDHHVHQHDHDKNEMIDHHHDNHDRHLHVHHHQMEGQREHPFARVKESETYKKMQFRLEPNRLRNSNNVDEDERSEQEETVPSAENEEDKAEPDQEKREDERCDGPALTKEEIEIMLDIFLSKKQLKIAKDAKKMRMFLDSGFLSLLPKKYLSSCSSQKKICVRQKEEKEERQQKDGASASTGICMDKNLFYDQATSATATMDDASDYFYDVPAASAAVAVMNIASSRSDDDIDEEDSFVEHTSSVVTTLTTMSTHGIQGRASRNLQTDYCVNFVTENCNGNRPVINKDGGDFRSLIDDCIFKNGCPSGYNYPTIPIGCWDTARVTDMQSAFSSQFYFNEPINCWDVSRVTNMGLMFNYAKIFNQPIKDWDVSRVLNMGAMFYGAYKFSQPIDYWIVSRVTDMSKMFYYGDSFNQCLGSWADKTGTDQPNTNGMLYDTVCPLGVGDPNKAVGPWCQGAADGCTVPPKEPSIEPSTEPSTKPSVSGKPSLSLNPSRKPSSEPNISLAPSRLPSRSPSQAPSTSNAPSEATSKNPSHSPSQLLSNEPSNQPSQVPSNTPSQVSSEKPSESNAPSTDFPCTDNIMLELVLNRRKRERTVNACTFVRKNQFFCKRGRRASKLRLACPDSCNVPRCSCVDSKFVVFRVGKRKFKKRCKRIKKSLCGKYEKVLNTCPNNCGVLQCLES